MAHNPESPFPRFSDDPEAALVTMEMVSDAISDEDELPRFG